MTPTETGRAAEGAGDPIATQGATSGADAALSRGLPGGVAVSRLRVYDWPAADGLHGGSPHLHTASAEGYVVVAGRGRVQTLSSQGLAMTDLAQGAIAWFTPGTVHRLINDDGELELLTLMSNAGLPETGDAVLTFPAGILADPEAYASHAVLPASGSPEQLAEAARRRRDLALEGFADLCARAAAHLDSALNDLYAAAAALVAGRAPSWKALMDAGPAAQSAATASQLERLAAGRAGSMVDSGIRSVAARPGEKYGMCGRLTTWEVDS